jgi:hypothetical protein
MRFKQLSERQVTAGATDLGGVVERGLDGRVYFLSVEHSVVHGLGADGSIQRVQLDTTLESATADVALMQDIAVDSLGGYLYRLSGGFNPRAERREFSCLTPPAIISARFHCSTEPMFVTSPWRPMVTF